MSSKYMCKYILERMDSPPGKACSAPPHPHPTARTNPPDKLARVGGDGRLSACFVRSAPSCAAAAAAATADAIEAAGAAFAIAVAAGSSASSLLACEE
eukprot:5458300-Pleurochrysis_carterae.AAC.6